MNTYKYEKDIVIDDCLNWDPDDFRLGHAKAQFEYIEKPQKELKVRRNNLQELAKILNDFEVPFWLQGKTLLGIWHNNQLLAQDHDDDIGILKKYHTKVCNQIYPVLRKNGFQAIRNNECTLSILRDCRYIDICFFEYKRDKIGYGTKWFPKEFFEKFESISFCNMVFKVPQKTNELLSIMYPRQINISGYARTIIQISKKLLKKIASLLVRKKTIIKPLSYQEFLESKIEADGAINWVLRKPHMDLVTNNGRNRKIKDIIDFFSDKYELENTKKSVIETDTSEIFEEPIHLNKDFWQTGNNFLFYSIYYGFKKNIQPYNKANEYIISKGIPILYSAEYFESLTPMGIQEIKDLLKRYPVVIRNGAICHGKHRVLAMIGKIIAGEEYIPFYFEKEIYKLRKLFCNE